MAQLNIDYIATDALIPRTSNPRTHSEAQIQQLMRSIEYFGFTNPVLIDPNGMLIAGHGRVEAAKRLGRKAVPTICLSGMSEDDIRPMSLPTTGWLRTPVGTMICWRWNWVRSVILRSTSI